ATARARDERTRRAILEGRHGDIGPYDACGCVAIGGLLVAARPRRLVARTLAMTTSAAASGDTSRDVGYGSFALAPAGRPEPREAHWLLARARSAIAHELATGEPDPLDDDDVPERLRSPGCSFVTLEREGELAGFIGTLQPSRPLWRDVARNARGAAFADPRFPQLAAGDLDRTAVKGGPALRPRADARHPRRPARRAAPRDRRPGARVRRAAGGVPALGVADPGHARALRVRPPGQGGPRRRGLAERPAGVALHDDRLRRLTARPGRGRATRRGRGRRDPGAQPPARSGAGRPGASPATARAQA